MVQTSARYGAAGQLCGDISGVSACRILWTCLLVLFIEIWELPSILLPRLRDHLLADGCVALGYLVYVRCFPIWNFGNAGDKLGVCQGLVFQAFYILAGLLLRIFRALCW